VTALARLASIDKPEYVAFANRGVIVKPIELDGPSDILVQALTGMDVVISTMALLQLREETALIEAAHKLA